MMFMLFSTCVVSLISSMGMHILVMCQVERTHTSLLLNILFGMSTRFTVVVIFGACA